MSDWDSRQYLKFEKERTQPAVDLANRIGFKDPRRILDIGCGPGNSTRVLKHCFPHAQILGVDNSPGMIETAKRQNPDLEFALCDAKQDLPALGLSSYDVVFSNACIQWIPDHPKLLREMLSLVSSRGILAVQLPLNFEQPVHRILRETAAREQWKDKIPNARIFYTLSQGEYFDLLNELSPDFSLWETVYYQTMDSYEALIEWYRGTGMRPYLSALSEEQQPEFEKEVMEGIKKAYPVQKSGKILFPFPRLFFTASPK